VLDTIANGMLSYVIGDGADIQGDVKTGTISDGTIEFTAWWTPLTAGATFVAA
jgi:hypothetical protein